MSKDGDSSRRMYQALRARVLLLPVVWLDLIGCFSPTPTREPKTTDASLDGVAAGHGSEAGVTGDGTAFGSLVDSKPAAWDGNVALGNDLPQSLQPEAGTGGMAGSQSGANSGAMPGTAGMGGEGGAGGLGQNRTAGMIRRLIGQRAGSEGKGGQDRAEYLQLAALSRRADPEQAGRLQQE